MVQKKCHNVTFFEAIFKKVSHPKTLDFIRVSSQKHPPKLKPKGSFSYTLSPILDFFPLSTPMLGHEFCPSSLSLHLSLHLLFSAIFRHFSPFFAPICHQQHQSHQRHSNTIII